MSFDNDIPVERFTESSSLGLNRKKTSKDSTVISSSRALKDKIQQYKSNVRPIGTPYVEKRKATL